MEVCQRRLSDISTRAPCPSGGCLWSPTTAVRVNSLHSTASSSDLYWTAQLRVQRTCSVKQSSTSLVRKRHWLHLRQNWKRRYLFRRSQWLSKTTRRCCGAVAAFLRFRRRDLSNFTYLLVLYSCFNRLFTAVIQSKRFGFGCVNIPYEICQDMKVTKVSDSKVTFKVTQGH